MPPKKSTTPTRFAFDNAFQEKVIRLLFQDEGFAAASDGRITPDYFENHVHRWVAKKIFWYHQTYGAHPTSTVLKRERIKDAKFKLIKPEERRAYRRFCTGRLKKPVTDRTYVKGEVQSFIKEQTIKQAVLRVAEELLPDRKYGEIDKLFANAVDVDVTGNNTVGDFPGRSWRTRMRKREEVQEEGIPTGITGIDRLMINGGLQKKQLATVLGITGRGKTNFLIDRGWTAVLNGFATVYYTLELDEESVNTRIDARATGVGLKLLKQNPEAVERGWKKIPQKLRDSFVVKEFPMGEFTIGMMEAHLKRLERYAFYPKLVVIDYVDLMRPTVTYDSGYETLGALHTGIRGFAQKHALAIWTGSQGNRAAMNDEKGDIGLGNASESTKKTFVADVVIGLNQGPKEKKQGHMRAAILKNRNGPADREVPLSVDHDKCKFEDRR